MKDGLIAVALLGIAVWLYWRDRRVRSGADRKWLATYRNPDLPAFLRNGAFVLRFAAGTALSWGIAGVATWGARAGALPVAAANLLTLAASSIGIIFLIVGLVVLYRPPESLKPNWLRLEDGHTHHHIKERRIDRAADLIVIAIPLLLIAAALVSGLLLFLDSLLS